MKTKFKLVAGLFLMLSGLLITGFCKQIVFPGLEHVICIETIVGKDNVIYQPDGSYYFTNPFRMVEWQLSVAIAGILLLSFGIWISGIRIKLPAKKKSNGRVVSR